jgi:hypothetical protein
MALESPRPLGALPPVRDERDFLMRAVLPPRGTLLRRYHSKPFTLDQGPYGSCVTNAWTHYLAAGPIVHLDRARLNPDNQPSPGQLWWTQVKSGTFQTAWGAPKPGTAEEYAVDMYDKIHELYEDPDPERDDGCYTVDGAKILKKRGLISAYYNASSVDDVVTALLNQGPVVFAMPWYKSAYSPYDAYGNKYLRVDVSSGIVGYHAMELDAVDLAPDAGPAFVRAHQSWGPWGYKGTVRIPIEPELHTLFIGSAYIATEVPTSAA